MTAILQGTAIPGASPTARRFPFTAAGVALGDTVTGEAVLLDREDKQTRVGKPMTTLTLRNAVGAATIPVWSEGLPAVAGLTAGTPVLLTATWTHSRGGTGEWKFESALPLEPDHPVVLEAQPVAPVTLAQLGARAMAFLALLSPAARELFDVLMNTPVAWANGLLEPMKSRFIEAPAATANHHATIRGLFFHGVQVTELALAMAETMRRTGDAPDLDLDAVVLGAFWHDVGKLDELSWRGAFKYTAKAAVSTHMGLGLMRITEAVTRAEVTTAWVPTTRQRELVEVLQHVISSHHGTKEWGALVTPASRESWLVSCADQASAKIQPITDTAGTGTPLADGWTRVGTGWSARPQFISPTATREGESAAGGLLQLVLAGSVAEVSDAG